MRVDDYMVDGVLFNLARAPHVGELSRKIFAEVPAGSSPKIIVEELRPDSPAGCAAFAKVVRERTSGHDPPG